MIDANVVQISFSAVVDIGVTPEELQRVFESHLAKLLNNGVSQETFNKHFDWLTFDLDPDEYHAGTERASLTKSLILNEPLVDYRTRTDGLRDINLHKFNELIRPLSAPGHVVVRHFHAQE